MIAGISDSLLQQARSTLALAPEATSWTLSEMRERYRLYEGDAITVVYAPVEYVSVDARLVILGITPGLQQAQIAFETAVALRSLSPSEVGREIKRRAAFAGAMRANLVAMLDELGVQAMLGIASTSDLFSDHANLLHSTSALRYPVFKNGENYTGYSPEPTRHPVLTWMLERVLAPELAQVPNALIVPLGGSVERVLEYLTERGLLSEARWLRGFPHPSGANGHRKSLFAKHRMKLAEAVRDWSSEQRV